MARLEELKASVNAAIDARRTWLIDTAKTILDHPEAGFQEEKTARLVSERLNEIGIAHETGIAMTGIKGYIRGDVPGPTVAVIGELDSLRVPGHPHADPGNRGGSCLWSQLSDWYDVGRRGGPQGAGGAGRVSWKYRADGVARRGIHRCGIPLAAARRGTRGADGW